MESYFSIHTSPERLKLAAVYASFISFALFLVGAGYSVSAYQYGFLIPEIAVSTLLIAIRIDVETRRPILIFNLILLLLLSGMMCISLDLINGMYANASEMGFWYSCLRFFLSVVFCYLIYLFFIALIGRVKKAAIVCTILLMIFGVVSYAVWVLRGSRLLFADILAVRTAIEVLGGYNALPTSCGLFLGIISVICALPVLFQLRSESYRLTCKMRLGFYLIFLYTFFIIYSTGFEQFEYSWSEVENSYVYSFFANAKLLTIRPSKEYTPEKAEETIMDASAQARFIESGYSTQKAIHSAFPQYNDSDVVRPNIIVIMNESYSDLEVFGDIDSEEVFPVTSHLQNSLQGDVFTEVYGGGTADSEYSFLTGNSTLILPTNARPYQLYVDKDTPNIVTQLRNTGYEAVALHPGLPTSWSRDTVYHDFNFNAFYDNSAFTGAEYKRIPALISDEAINDKIIEVYANKGISPLFAFDVTIQNHGGYTLGYENLEKLEVKDDIPEEVVEYLSLVRASDIAFGELIDFFKTQSQPTIVCMFGDHQPNLTSGYIESVVGKEKEDFSIKEDQRLQATPYVIWANYPLPKTQVGSVGINYLSTILLECAGIETTPYQKYLASLYKKYLILDRKGIIDKNGDYYNYSDGKLNPEYQEDIDNFKDVLYYSIIDSENRDDKYFTVPDG